MTEHTEQHFENVTEPGRVVQEEAPAVPTTPAPEAPSQQENVCVAEPPTCARALSLCSAKNCTAKMAAVATASR